MINSNVKKILAALALFFIGFVSYVQTRPADFRYERSGIIQATPEVIFPYLNQFKLGNEWSPYSKKDPNMKFTISGPEAGTGSKMEFAGNSDVGAGELEIIASEPNSRVELLLTMKEPIEGKNTIIYSLTPEGEGTRFTWTMSGKGGFISKLMTVLIDCEKMVAGDFEVGIQNLKTLIESKPH
jgi:hypothetical protein